jgi:hypothetical protein
MATDAADAARKAGIPLTGFRRYFKGPCSSVLIELSSERKLSWNLTNYERMEQIAVQHGLELVGRWLRKGVDGDYVYAAYVGDLCIRINPSFKDAKELLKEIRAVYA